VQTQRTFDEGSVGAIAGKKNDSGNEDQLSLLHEVINNLPESQRSALTLCYYQGFSNKEAAVIMNISVKALESAISRAKRTLRNQLTTNNEVPARKPEQKQEPK
jgi:RNA polymerase sigma-70 factor (ECF subfamily)